MKDREATDVTKEVYYAQYYAYDSVHWLREA